MVCGQMFYRVAVGELVCEVTAVGEYAGRPLKAGDAAQPRGCSARFVPAGLRAVWFLMSAVTLFERNVKRLLPIWHYNTVFA